MEPGILTSVKTIRTSARPSINPNRLVGVPRVNRLEARVLDDAACHHNSSGSSSTTSTTGLRIIAAILPANSMSLSGALNFTLKPDGA